MRAFIIECGFKSGESVAFSAVLVEQQIETVLRIFLRTLEHQVFKEMGKACFAWLFIGSTNLVGDSMQNQRRAMVFDHNHFHAVVEGEPGDWQGKTECRFDG